MRHRAAIFCLALGPVLASPAWGQEPLPTAAQGTATDSATVSYGPAFFATYDVTTAEDILRRIPGVAAVLEAVATQTQERGFGSRGDQILINGKRMAGKNQILATLRRLQVANIESIQLIRGTSAELDVQSEGLLINIVLKEGAGTGAGSWQLDARFNDRGKFNVDGLVNYSDSWGRLDYIVGLERNLWPPKSVNSEWSTRYRDEFYYFPDGVVQEIRNQRINRQHDKYILTTNLAYNFDSGDRFRLNGLFEPRDVVEQDGTALQRFNAAGVPTFIANDIRERHSGWVMRWEVGGDYVAALGPGTLNTLFIYNSTDNPVEEFRNQAVGATVSEVSRNLTTQLTTEGIVRSSYTWPVMTKQSLELGAEMARNTLTQNLRVFFDLNPRDGQVEEFPIPTARAKVQELRGEVFANHNWTLASDLTLESALNFEFSRISNNYPFSPTAEYKFLKPRFDLRYDLGAADQLRLKAERTVSQLQFANFVPVFDVIDSEIDAGNPDLRPEKTWVFETAYQHRLPNGQGLLEARAFYKDSSDHIDKFIIRREAGGDIVSATGNIGSAYVTGAEVKAGIRLRFLGLPDVGVDLRYLHQWSGTTDPFTGLRRDVGALYSDELDVGFRHDVTAWGLSYGAKFSLTEGRQVFSDARVLRLFERGPRLEAFAEQKLWGGLTGRLDAQGLMPRRSREYQSRVLYVRDAQDGAVLRREYFTEIRDRRFVLSLRGRF